MMWHDKKDKQLAQTKMDMTKFQTMRLDKSISLAYNALIKKELIIQEINEDYIDKKFVDSSPSYRVKGESLQKRSYSRFKNRRHRQRAIINDSKSVMAMEVIDVKSLYNAASRGQGKSSIKDGDYLKKSKTEIGSVFGDHDQGFDFES